MQDNDAKMTDQWEQQSREKQQRFMQNISQRLGRPMPTEPPKHPYKGAPAYWKQYDLPPEERIALFQENWTKAGGHVHRVASLQEAGQFITEQARQWNARLLLRQNQPECAALGLETALPKTKIVVWNPTENDKLLQIAAGADIGVTVADHAVAYTGSIVVTSSANSGRSVSLLPTVMIAIVPVERIRTRLGEALAHFDGRARETFPAGIHFISGPSRSADIENDLTIGVHGPGVVFAVVVG